MSQLKKKAIDYSTINFILENCVDERTRALIAIQYGFATRAGELASEYIHYYYKDSEEHPFERFVSKGPLKQNFNLQNDGDELTFLKPNFKQKKVKNNEKEISEVDRFTSIVIKKGEPFLFNIIYDWVRSKEYNQPIFDLKQAMIRRLIDKELKQYNSNWSSHWLRQSRAWHIGSATGDPYAVQAILGHGDLNTSLQYVSGLQTSLRTLFNGGKKMEDYLGKVVK